MTHATHEIRCVHTMVKSYSSFTSNYAATRSSYHWQSSVTEIIDSILQITHGQEQVQLDGWRGTWVSRIPYAFVVHSGSCLQRACAATSHDTRLRRGATFTSCIICMMSRISWFKLMVMIYGWIPWARVQWLGTLCLYRRDSTQSNFEFVLVSIQRRQYVHYQVEGSGKGSPGFQPDSLMCTCLRCSAYQWSVICRCIIITNRFLSIVKHSIVSGRALLKHDWDGKTLFLPRRTSVLQYLAEFFRLLLHLDS